MVDCAFARDQLIIFGFGGLCSLIIFQSLSIFKCLDDTFASVFRFHYWPFYLMIDGRSDWQSFWAPEAVVVAAGRRLRSDCVRFWVFYWIYWRSEQQWMITNCWVVDRISALYLCNLIDSVFNLDHLHWQKFVTAQFFLIFDQPFWLAPSSVSFRHHIKGMGQSCLCSGPQFWEPYW